AHMEAQIAARVQQEAEAATRAQAAAAAKAHMEAEIAARVQQEHAEAEARVQAAAETAAKAEAEAKAKAEAEMQAKAEAAAQARDALGRGSQPVGTRGVLGGSERTHVVVAGDSLYKIAAHFYGNGNRWPEIFEANKDIIKNPRIIRPGQKLRIP
ncbi:MAG: LysM peptidoglycan-binding domain-containing protein, partial [Anaerolineae bacterium]